MGREKILAAVRSLLRSKYANDLSRKTVAAHAGVTPALISYYFPKKQQLFEEAASPIISDYAREIIAIADSSVEPNVKSRAAIDVLVKLFRRDGRLLDIYREVAANSQQMENMSFALARIFGPNCTERSSIADPSLNFDAAILQGAIWGMCRFAALVDEQLPPTNTAGEYRVEALRRTIGKALVALIGSTSEAQSASYC